MRAVSLLLASSALLGLAACDGKEPIVIPDDTYDTSVAVDAPPGERVGSSLARDTAPAISDTSLATLTAGNRAFATDLYHQLTKPGENLFFSPHSISVALAMTYAGAEGTTETQMADVLGFSALPEADVHAGFNALDLALKDRATVPEDKTGDGFQLSIVNQTWGQTGYTFEDEFLDVLAVNYGAAMYLLDFGSDPDGARTQINDWVAASTADRITDLLPADAITSDTKLVLANAIYFKASWNTPFNKEQTQDLPFNLLDGSTSTVAMMRGDVSAVTAVGDGWSLIEVPYLGNEVDMTLLVPDAGRFEEVEAELTQPFLDAAIDAASSQLLTLKMPRFSFKTEVPLIPPLQALGMLAPFDGSVADFSGMSKESALTITGVYHQAFVAVDEEGTEAAAATAVVESDSASIPEDEFTVDRPFIVLIRDRPTGEILFLGRVLSPQ